MKRRAVITGGKKGIGKTIIDELKNHNYEVISLDHGYVNECNIENGVIEIKCDISDFQSVSTAYEILNRYWSKFDVLVNNAGVCRDTLFENMSFSQWDTVLKVNLYGTFFITKQSIEFLKKGYKPKIVNISSLSGKFVNKGQTNYGVSKAGIEMLTKYLAVELAQYNICVNAIEPGLIKTDMIEHIRPDILEKMISIIPLKRLGDMKDIAKTVLFLSSEQTNYITGEIIKVSGGLKV